MTKARPAVNPYVAILRRHIHEKIAIPLRKILIPLGFLRLRTKLRLLVWGIERPLFRLLRRKRVCIFYRPASNAGLFAVFRDFLGGIAYADRRAMIPVIDMKNVPNAYLFDDEVGRVNAWEYYFEQPSGISLDDAEQMNDAAIMKVGRYPVPRQDYALFTNQNGELDYWRSICRKYIHFSRPVLDMIEHESTKFAGRRVLGVSLRGTDYTALRVHDHPVQPTCEQVIAKASEVMSGQHYDALYLSTEDKKIAGKFRAVFGDRLILSECKYVDFDPASNKYITLYSTDRENDKYLMGLEYIVSKMLLTKCSGLITSITSGTAAVMFMSKGFEYLYVFDLGLY